MTDFFYGGRKVGDTLLGSDYPTSGRYNGIAIQTGIKSGITGKLIVCSVVTAVVTTHQMLIKWRKTY